MVFNGSEPTQDVESTLAGMMGSFLIKCFSRYSGIHACRDDGYFDGREVHLIDEIYTYRDDGYCFNIDKGEKMKVVINNNNGKDNPDKTPMINKIKADAAELRNAAFANLKKLDVDRDNFKKKQITVSEAGKAIGMANSTSRGITVGLNAVKFQRVLVNE